VFALGISIWSFPMSWKSFVPFLFCNCIRLFALLCSRWKCWYDLRFLCCILRGVFAAVAVGIAICRIFFNSMRVSYRFAGVALSCLPCCVRVASNDIIWSFCVAFYVWSFCCHCEGCSDLRYVFYNLSKRVSLYRIVLLRLHSVICIAAFEFQVPI